MHNILFVASEMAPFAKTGGLGDVVGSLPKSLMSCADVCVKVILPLYNTIKYEQLGLKKIMEGNCVQMGNCSEFFSIHASSHIPGVDVFFIEFNKYFARGSIYDDVWTGQAFADNGYRFAFFCKAALQAAKDLGFHPDVVHVHDWQTALVPYYVCKTQDPFFNGTKTLLTTHNLPYQGRFAADVLGYTGIAGEDFHAGAFEDYGCVNFLKGGIRFAHKLSTVSPNYAKEILTPQFGAGLDFLLRERKKDLVGILNGIDTGLWNPSKDLIIPKRYSFKTVQQGKQKNKEELCKLFHLKNPEAPVFAMSVRLAEQKGIKMLSECIEPVLRNMNCQFAIMGQGERWAHAYFDSLPKKYEGRIGVKIGFDSDTEHLMDAGGDFSLVPSLYEPCGLKQMVSQTYGALPIARSTGGLEDTILNYNEYYGVGTGFKFKDSTAKALYNTIGWANATYFDRPAHIEAMRKLSMQQDYSWGRSCLDYQKLYCNLEKE